LVLTPSKTGEGALDTGWDEIPISSVTGDNRGFTFRRARGEVGFVKEEDEFVVDKGVVVWDPEDGKGDEGVLLLLRDVLLECDSVSWNSWNRRAEMDPLAV